MARTPRDKRVPRTSREPPPSSGYLDATEQWDVGAFRGAPERDRGYAPTRGSEYEQRVETPPPRWAPRPARAEARHGRVAIRGVARSVQIRDRQDGPDVLLFRVDRYDAEGNRLQPVGVQMTAYRGGQISDGEEVAVNGSWSNGTVRASKVVNLTTGAEAKGVPHAVMRLGYFVIGVPVVAFLVFVLYSLFISHPGP
jgi:hypothetical protein